MPFSRELIDRVTVWKKACSDVLPLVTEASLALAGTPDTSPAETQDAKGRAAWNRVGHALTALGAAALTVAQACVKLRDEIQAEVTAGTQSGVPLDIKHMN